MVLKRPVSDKRVAASEAVGRESPVDAAMSVRELGPWTRRCFRKRRSVAVASVRGWGPAGAPVIMGSVL